MPVKIIVSGDVVPTGDANVYMSWDYLCFTMLVNTECIIGAVTV